ncbi:hypothetical protein PMI14_04722 [Acidovorax sp. CF316]|uniref:hypothetical protein n=1 Tax=Acidovorax sp. CF316 TaxID=1144317 RepID=UPI00026BD80F|nr:hypothetical protein [Acidovorax sp. CF316]EJE50625.1 hypothetical protein PMI14_04722 [Acidovorax sp. CF316]
MTLSTIELTHEEAELLALVDFEGSLHDDRIRSCAASAELMQLLLQRDAIPPSRLGYFTDPAFNGGKMSRLQRYEENGTRGAEIFAHGGFLRYARYFIHGAALDEAVKAHMAKLVGDPTEFSGEDL